jgi:hypothetical protein
MEDPQQDAQFIKFVHSIACTTHLHTLSEDKSIYYATRTTEMYFHLKRRGEEYNEFMRTVGSTHVHVLWIEDSAQTESIVHGVFNSENLVILYYSYLIL